MADTYFVVAEAAHNHLVDRAFTRRGYCPDEASSMVRLCCDAARHGIRTHNAIKALHLDELFGVRTGGCVPGVEIEDLPLRFPASRAWNAHRKPGPGVAYAAMDQAMDLARTYGVGMVSVQQAWHYLWGGAYVLEAARKGFIGYTNCTAMLAEVVPHGGRRPTLGTNPHSWAFPTQDLLGFPVLVDFATSSVAMGRVQQFAREGRPLAPGWAVDADGQETRDPARASALLPFGAHKGFGLGLIDELMAGWMGACRPTHRGRFKSGDPTDRSPSFFFMAMHPEALGGGDAILDRVRAVLDDIRGPGNEAVVFPGELEAANARRCRDAGGLLFTAAEMDGFDAVAAECGEPPWNRVSWTAGT